MTAPIDVEQPFRRAMASSGITTSDPIIADGKLHRFHVEGDKPGSKNGWYVLHSDSPVAGAYGCWKRGISMGWGLKDVSELSGHERTEYNRRMEQVKADRAQEQRRVWGEAQAKAQRWWKSAKPAPDSHPYLREKRINSHGAKSYRDSLIVPLRDAAGIIHSLQYIAGDGTKRFLTGSRVSGCYFSFGKPNGVIYVAEGFSTAATVHEATREAVVAAFSGGNLKAVAKGLREKFPDVQIIIAADNDKTGGNPGKTKAIEAAKAVGGLVALPTFRDGQIGTDWNDLCRIEGAKEVLRQLQTATPPPSSNDPQAEVEVWLKRNSTGPDSIQEALQALSPVQYDHFRNKVAEHAGIRVSTLDNLVNANRESRETEVQGGSIEYDETIPWIEPVEGSLLLDELVSAFQRFIIWPERGVEVLALWTVHTYAHEAAYHSPYLALTSPEKRCGKTKGLEVLDQLVLRSMPTSNISASAIFRSIEKWKPTLIIDENDTFLKLSDELRGILNAGHSRGQAWVIRTVGNDFEPRRFSVWAAKALALIGNLPDTIADRSIIIKMRRKTDNEEIQEFRPDKFKEISNLLRRKIARWVADHFNEIKDIDPEVPETLNDRAKDNWRPLLSIADIAGGEWPERARQAAETLSGAGDTEDSYRVQLLEDVWAVFEKANSPDSIKTADLLTALNGMEDRPWCEWRKGQQPMSARSLSILLKPYGIKPKQIRFGTETMKGYSLESFADTFSRYTPLLKAKQIWRMFRIKLLVSLVNITMFRVFRIETPYLAEGRVRKPLIRVTI